MRMNDVKLAVRQFALFVSAVRTMRTAQKLYFKTRAQNDLVLSKGYEKRVDALLKDLDSQTPEPQQ
jgi:hypothetical protein